MARCKDCIHYNVCCLWSTKDLDEDEAYKYCFGNFKTTADVVPKSEVEKIFEDIEKMLKNQEVVAKNPREKELGDWILHNYIPKKIAELKKKYTEDKG